MKYNLDVSKIISPLTFYQPLSSTVQNNITSSSFLMADGKVLVVWSDFTGTEIKQGYADDVDDFMNNNTLSNVSSILTGLENPVAMLSDLEDSLFLIVSYIQKDSDKIAKSLLYKSALRDGSDWTLYSTIFSYSWSSLTKNTISAYGVTEIAKVNGHYVIACSHYESWNFYYLNSKNAIYTSDDLINWTLRNTFSANSLGTSSNFIEISGITYWANIVSYSGLHFQLYKSNDGFISNATTLFDISPQTNTKFPYYSCSLWADDANFYIVGSNDMAGAEWVSICGTTLDTIGDYAKYTQVFNSGINTFNAEGGNTYLCSLGNKYAFWICDKFFIFDGNSLKVFVITDTGLKQAKKMFIITDLGLKEIKGLKVITDTGLK